MGGGGPLCDGRPLSDPAALWGHSTPLARRRLASLAPVPRRQRRGDGTPEILPHAVFVAVRKIAVSDIGDQAEVRRRRATSSW